MYFRKAASIREPSAKNFKEKEKLVNMKRNISKQIADVLMGGISQNGFSFNKFSLKTPPYDCT